MLGPLCSAGSAPAGAGGGAAPVYAPGAGPLQRTKQPIVTGTSVLAVKYKDGVMMACDTLGSYGTLAKYKDLRRMAEVNEKCLIGAGGEYSDFQYIQSLLDELRTDDANLADGFTLSPAEIFSYLRVVLYNRRSKFNPLWNNLVVAGFTGGKPFLGTVDLIGTAFEDDLIATGFGAHLALPLMRKALDETPAHLMEEGVARALLEDCLRVLFYRDCRALNRVQVRARALPAAETARASARAREREGGTGRVPPLLARGARISL